MTDQPWSIWAQLSVNLLSVAFFISLWANLQFWFAVAIRPVRHVLFGAVMGMGAIASVLMSIRLGDGIMFDLRGALIAIAGLFGGPIAALVAGAFVGIFRFWLGGPGMLVGLANIVLAASLGSIGHLTVPIIRSYHVGMLAVATGATWFLSYLALPDDLLAPDLLPLVVPVTLLTTVATMVAGMIVLQTRRAAEERVLLRAAIAQSPEFQFVKNERSEFVAVNREVANYNGFERPEHMIGLTDFDLVSDERATALYEGEQEVLSSGQPLIDFEEHLLDRGIERWFSTSKSPIRNEDGKIIGIAGVTREITQRRKMEQDLIESRNLLDFAVSEMADGLAMFDADGRLKFCNERYRTLFPRTAYLRKPGVHLREIMQAVVRTEEQINTSRLPDQQWIEAVVDSLSSGGDQQVQLFNGRWLHLRTRATSSGAAVLVSDVTMIKRSEEQAILLAGEMQRLASTDGLTGLLNRRSFDAQLTSAHDNARLDNVDLSILMIDVDKFKSFNDHYGHPQGDECLKAIGRCLREAVRARDLAARYGGEEFAVILPATSADEAAGLADRIRTEIAAMAISHAASPMGIVTASIGVASSAEIASIAAATDLVLRADQALYRAKRMGRNRTMIWKPEMDALVG